MKQMLRASLCVAALASAGAAAAQDTSTSASIAAPILRPGAIELGLSGAFTAVEGTREEWIGSFREVRIPVGLTFGLRTLAGERAAARVEYRLRRVLHDPVADLTEQQVWVGLSLLFHNARRGHS